jgi:hypothetical protein
VRQIPQQFSVWSQQILPNAKLITASTLSQLTKLAQQHTISELSLDYPWQLHVFCNEFILLTEIRSQFLQIGGQMQSD